MEKQNTYQKNHFVLYENEGWKIGRASNGQKYKTITCPHCGLVGGKMGMDIWHFDNCKYNPDKIEMTVLKIKPPKLFKIIEYYGENYRNYNDLKQKTGCSKYLYSKYYLNGIDPRPYYNLHNYTRKA